MNLLRLSLLLNLVGFVVFIAVAITYRDKFTQRFIKWKGDGKIVMFGNSITASGKWAELLGRTDVINSGFPGLCTYHFLGILQSQVIDLKPDVCFVMGGINDITVGVEQAKIQANYREILDKILENDIIPVVTLTLYKHNNPANNLEVDRLNRFLIDYCTTQKIEYIDLNPLVCDSLGLKMEYAVDDTHLNSKAYTVWAKAIRASLIRKKI
jgi:lysophospholipase L1-like esterase